MVSKLQYDLLLKQVELLIRKVEILESKERKTSESRYSLGMQMVQSACDNLDRDPPLMTSRQRRSQAHNQRIIQNDKGKDI